MKEEETVKVQHPADGYALVPTLPRVALDVSGSMARLFIQADHGEALADFMRIVATVIPTRDVLKAIQSRT
jgi:hypothetical protein